MCTVLLVLVLAHIFWYAASRKALTRQIPGEDVIRSFQKEFFPRLNIEADPQSFEQVYLDVGGFRIHLDVLKGANSKITVVFIPGTTAYAQLYSEFLKAMNDQGFNVVGLDPRGHGRSSGLRGDYTIDGIIDDTLAAVKYAAGRFGGNIVVAGSSQGGIAAFYTAARDSSISAVVCHNLADLNGKDNMELSRIPVPGWATGLLLKVMRIYKDFALPVSLYIDLTKERLKDGSDALTYLKKDPLCYQWISLRALGSLLSTPLARPVENISVPVLIVHSSLDNIFPKHYVEGIYGRLTCKKGYLLFEGLPHLLFTNHVSEVVPPISKWLRETLAI